MKMRFRIFSLLVTLSFILGACSQALPATETTAVTKTQSASQPAADDVLMDPVMTIPGRRS